MEEKPAHHVFTCCCGVTSVKGGRKSGCGAARIAQLPVRRALIRSVTCGPDRPERERGCSARVADGRPEPRFASEESDAQMSRGTDLRPRKASAELRLA